MVSLPAGVAQCLICDYHFHCHSALSWSPKCLMYISKNSAVSVMKRRFLIPILYTALNDVIYTDPAKHFDRQLSTLPDPCCVDFTRPLELCCLKLCTKMSAVGLLRDARYVCCGLFQTTQQQSGCRCRMFQDKIFTQLYSILTLLALLHLSFIDQ